MPRVDWLITGLRVRGGAETFVRRLAPLLRKDGWDIRIITIINGGGLIDELRNDEVPVIELGLRHRIDVTAAMNLYRLWKRNPPDLVHTHLYHAGILGRILAPRLNIPNVIVHQHGAEQARSRMRSLLDRSTSSQVSCYVASCKFVASLLSQREKISESKIEIVYNGVDIQPFYPDKPAEWPFDQSQFCIGCVGRLSEEKGQLWLLQALYSLKNRNQRLHAIFIGNGPNRNLLENRAQRLGIGEQVHFTGIIPDARQWLPFFDLFVLPSDWEGVSLALLEAMSASLPIIATAVGGTPEVVIDGETGLLVPPKDPEILSQAIQKMVDSPLLRHEMGVRAKNRVEKIFSIGTTVEKLEFIYKGLIN